MFPLACPTLQLACCFAIKNLMTISHLAGAPSCFQLQLPPPLPSEFKLPPSSWALALCSTAQNDLAYLERSKALCLNAVSYGHFSPPCGLLSYSSHSIKPTAPLQGFLPASFQLIHPRCLRNYSLEPLNGSMFYLCYLHPCLGMCFKSPQILFGSH